MDIQEIIQLQREFDRQHGWDWHNLEDQAEFSKALQYEVIALSGEVGEIANCVKKILRDDMASIEHRETINEMISPEIVDAFIYLMKMAITLDIDIEKAYLEKMAVNRKRFTRYENYQ